jgi:uncharacterized protein YaiI (UPF0178 family)
MRLWIDADAAPRLMKDVVFRVSDRTGLAVTLVANRWQQTPRSPHIKMVVVGDGFDEADDYIVEHCEPGDIVVSADILLADRIVSKGVALITPNGQELDADNIAERVGKRNFMEEARSAELVGGGPPPYSLRNQQQFTNALDRVITTQKRRY